MLCNATLERTTSKLASSKGSLRASPVSTSTLSATPSIIALSSVPAALLPLRSSCCHLSIPTARPVESRLAAPIRNKRSEEHTSELQSHSDLVCRLLLEKKKQKRQRPTPPRQPAQR